MRVAYVQGAVGLQSSVPSRGVWGHQHGWPQMGEMVGSPKLPNRPKAPPRRPRRPHAQARHLHTHETIIASGSVTAGTGGVWIARAVGAHGVGKPTAALPCVFESGVLLENGSGLCCTGGRPRSPLLARPAASTPPGAPRTTHRYS